MGGVHTLTGAYSFSRTDVSLKGLGPAPEFTRTYNSNDTVAGPFGAASPGWTHNYATRLVRPQDGGPNDVVLVGPQGRRDRYTGPPDAQGVYLPPAGRFAELKRLGDGTYTVTQTDQTVWRFSAGGRLQSISDRYGNTSTLTYDGQGRLTAVSDPAGRDPVGLWLDYDAQGRLWHVTDWLAPARVVTFGYDSGTGALVTVTDRASQPTTYRYAGTGGRLDQVTNALGHVVVQSVYDAQGRVTSQRDARGVGGSAAQETTFSYATNQTTVTMPPAAFQSFRAWTIHTYSGGWLSGTQTRFSTDPNDGGTTAYTYDARGNRLTSTDSFNQATNYCYDSRGNVVRRIDPSVNGSRPTRLYEFDSRNNLTREVAARGVDTTNLAVDCTTDLYALGRVNLDFATDRAYDGSNQLTAVTRRYRPTYPTGAAVTALTTYEYATGRGLVTKETPPRGNADPAHNYATTYTYYSTGSQAGLRQTKTNAQNETTQYGYDAVGRRTLRIDEVNQSWGTSYDNEDRPLTLTGPDPVYSNAVVLAQYTYDAVGNRTVAQDAAGQLTRYAYDSRELLQQVTQSPTQRDPNADAQPLVTLYDYDDVGSLRMVTRRQGAQLVRRFDYSYDGGKRLRQEIEYTDPTDFVTASKQLIRSYTYNNNGRLATATKPNGGTISHGYDVLNRQTGLDYSDTTPDASFAYDANGNRTSMTDGSGTTSYLYDERDQLVAVTYPGGAQLQYRYDGDGQRSQLIYPNGQALSYNRDFVGRVTSLSDWASRATTYTYRPTGQMTQVHQFNGTFQTRAYDNQSRLTSVTNQQANGTIITQDNYTLDAVGNRTGIGGTVASLSGGQPSTFTVSYDYDYLYRLTGFNDSPGTLNRQDYTYDAAFNRATMASGGTTNRAYTYDGADRLRAVDDPSQGTPLYQFEPPDPNGNLPLGPSGQFGLLTYTYDLADRLTSTATIGMTATMTYDGDGRRATRRVQQTGSDTTTQYIDDVAGKLAQTVQDRNLRYVRGAELAYATDLSGNPRYVYHLDGQGSVRAITNASGIPIYMVRYDPYGAVRAQEGSVAPDQVYGFVGEQFDPEPELIYLRARAYSPTLGRFLQRDSEMGDLNNPASLNRYTYVGNNPVNQRDPSGHVGLWDLGFGFDPWSMYGGTFSMGGYGFGGFGGYGFGSLYGGFGGYGLGSFGYSPLGFGSVLSDHQIFGCNSILNFPCGTGYFNWALGIGGLIPVGPVPLPLGIGYGQNWGPNSEGECCFTWPTISGGLSTPGVSGYSLLYPWQTPTSGWSASITGSLGFAGPAFSIGLPFSLGLGIGLLPGASATLNFTGGGCMSGLGAFLPIGC